MKKRMGHFKREAIIMLLLLIIPLLILAVIVLPRFFAQRKKARAMNEQRVEEQTKINNQLINKKVGGRGE